MPLTCVRCPDATFADLKSGFQKIDIKGRKAVILNGGDQLAVHTSIRTCAKVTVRGLSPEHFAATANKNIFAGDASLTQNQLLKLVEDAVGTKFTVTHETSDEARQRGLGKLAVGQVDLAAVSDIILADFYNENSSSAWGEGDNSWLGVEKQSVAEVVRRVVKEVEQ